MNIFGREYTFILFQIVKNNITYWTVKCTQINILHNCIT